MVKLNKILESMDSFVINSDVALLEAEGLDALTIAQTKKTIHESFKFIKSELIQGGILEETQGLLANAWTQAILEDIHVPSADEIASFGNKVAGGAQYAGHALAGNAGVVSGALQGGNPEMIQPSTIAQNVVNAAKQGYSQGYQNNAPSVATDYKIGEMVGEHPVATTAAVGAGLLGAGAATNAVAGKVVRRFKK